jgi:SAM-dependent methyltransferase
VTHTVRDVGVAGSNPATPTSFRRGPARPAAQARLFRKIARRQQAEAMAQSETAKALSCPACGVERAHRFLYSKNGCDILQCAVCGLGRAQASGFDPGSYYTGDYFSGQHADGYADYLGSEPVLRREFAHTVQFVRRFRPGGHLLEVGCAYGFFLQEARPYFEVAGIELAEDAAAYGRRQGLRVLSGIADQHNLAQLGAMDIIVLLDVIEHLPDPRETLALLTRHLNPGGIIVVTTGDFASLYARLAGAHWRLMTPPQHLWYFTRDSIQRMAQALGLRLESYDHSWKIVPIALIVYQIGARLGFRFRGMRSASRLGIPVNLFDAMRVVLRKS